MNFHEYQAKELFASYGIPVPAGINATTAEEAVAAAQELGGDMWVVKAQVHAGGRGKAGGVKLVRSLDDVRAEAERMLSMTIETYQTGGLALPVDSVLIAEATDIETELYLSALVKGMADNNTWLTGQSCPSYKSLLLYPNSLHSILFYLQYTL